MKKILILEDEPDMAKVLAKRLGSRGYETLIAQDAMLGLAEAHKRPDLIILDMHLPAGGGMSVLSDLRMSLNTRGIPVFVLTGDQSQALKAEAITLGIQAYFTKPYDFDQLMAAIAAWVGD